ncbi:anhydro-N-acetylmuramic acid kinase [Actinokineospora alba]|uniref:Anhydro-N-acetylmuramic acid kinase n=1 Tax=Actinokineospora alba TaxID=504798 RepID=A0A1H0I3S1_9PSEU|nr:anhydro-N-acetylmuramic acid kinase [Actinokineospora alba]TDP64617.1 anhydro-N-acetylmuramic acid kinase [Actinokineospora alba]SDI85851.1 anhydro-N-acetylmuramic acid kinase [Actinokineospora alba]SDO26078.1 anhydro-N-acetylmuramic acid kinase [Actinokineospora alba]
MGWYRVVGVISGTSMDGVDVAVADLTVRGDTIDLVPVRHAQIPYPDDLRDALTAALPPGDCSAETLCKLDTAVGQAFAEAVVAVGAEGADLVASLGQTLFHWVDGGRCLGTLQLGQPAWIAEATGLPVVADLRARDVAAGGHGAPLALVLDRLLLSDPDTPTAALNLGGIANITVLTPNSPAIAFDTGPGNALLDAAAQSRLGTSHDVDGAHAATGTVREDLLGVLLRDPYYAAPPPKSTGKELFNGTYLDAALARVGPVADAELLATLVALTATTVADACRRHDVKKVVASGGGVHNTALLSALRTALDPVPLSTTDDLGLPVDAKEAYLAALLGFLTWSGIAVDPATGAAGPRLLGSITPGTRPVSPPDPVGGNPRRLRIVVPQPLGGVHART